MLKGGIKCSTHSSVLTAPVYIYSTHRGGIKNTTDRLHHFISRVHRGGIKCTIYRLVVY